MEVSRPDVFLKSDRTFPTEAALLAEERDEIRKQDPSDARIKELAHEINSIVQEHCREKW